jgi:hypothetical protein
MLGSLQKVYQVHVLMIKQVIPEIIFQPNPLALTLQLDRAAVDRMQRFIRLPSHCHCYDKPKPYSQTVDSMASRFNS